MDPNFYVWCLRWWPYAVVHGLNPLYTHQIGAPAGQSLAWVTTIPPLALLAAPITLASGPVVTFNLLSAIAPAVSAWAAFVLCRRLTGRFWAALVGGAVFGFSAFEMNHSAAGQLNLTYSLLLPILAYLVVVWWQGSISGRAFVFLAALMMATQFYLFLETFADLTAFLVVALGAGLLLGGRDSRPVSRAAGQEPRSRLRCRDRGRTAVPGVRAEGPAPQAVRCHRPGCRQPGGAQARAHVRHCLAGSCSPRTDRGVGGRLHRGAAAGAGDPAGGHLLVQPPRPVPDLHAGIRHRGGLRPGALLRGRPGRHAPVGPAVAAADPAQRLPVPAHGVCLPDPGRRHGAVPGRPRPPAVGEMAAGPAGARVHRAGHPDDQRQRPDERSGVHQRRALPS